MCKLYFLLNHSSAFFYFLDKYNVIHFLEVQCVTQHEGFEAVCLNPYVLWAAMVGLNDREGAWLPPEDNIPNR